MALRAFAVSLVYVKIDHSCGNFATDEEGMPTGFTFSGHWLDVACTTGTAVTPTPELAILEVRKWQNNREYLYQGWTEQIVQAHEVPYKNWWLMTIEHATYWRKWLLWRARKALRDAR